MNLIEFKVRHQTKKPLKNWYAVNLQIESVLVEKLSIRFFFGGEDSLNSEIVINFYLRLHSDFSQQCTVCSELGKKLS